MKQGDTQTIIEETAVTNKTIPIEAGGRSEGDGFLFL
jgi:hypothetical protein